MEQPPQYQPPSYEQMQQILAAVQEELKKTKEELCQALRETAKSNDDLTRTKQEWKYTKDSLTRLHKSEQESKDKYEHVVSRYISTSKELTHTEQTLKRYEKHYKKMFIVMDYLRFHNCVTDKQSQNAIEYYSSWGNEPLVRYRNLSSKSSILDFYIDHD